MLTYMNTKMSNKRDIYEKFTGLKGLNREARLCTTHILHYALNLVLPRYSADVCNLI